MERDWWDESLCGGSYHTHLSQEAAIHPLAELLYSTVAVEAAEGMVWLDSVWAAAGRQDDPHPEWQQYYHRKYHYQIPAHGISPPHVCLLLKKTKSGFSLLCNICRPWHELNQLPINLISTKPILEKMASLRLLGILGTESTLPLFQGKAFQFMKYKV